MHNRKQQRPQQQAVVLTVPVASTEAKILHRGPLVPRGDRALSLILLHHRGPAAEEVRFKVRHTTVLGFSARCVIVWYPDLLHYTFFSKSFSFSCTPDCDVHVVKLLIDESFVIQIALLSKVKVSWAAAYSETYITSTKA